MNKTFSAICLSLISNSVLASTYDQILAEYNGGVIGSVNNCGVNFSVAPQYLRGAGSVQMHAPGEYFYGISSLGEAGVVSVVKNGDVFYSPNALDLSGGGSTIKLGNVGSFDNFSVRPSVVEVEDEAKVLILREKFGALSVDVFNSSGPLGSYFFTMYDFIGYANGDIFAQTKEGDIRSFGSINDLISSTGSKFIENTSKAIQAVRSYNGGVLTVADGGLYYSSNADKLIGGENVENLYPENNGKIDEVIVVSGEPKYIPIAASDPMFFIPVKNDNIVYTTKEGAINWNAESALHPVNLDLLKRKLPDNSIWDAYEIDRSVNLLNFRKGKEYGAGFFAAESVLNETTGIAVGLNGRPATVELYDKGWHDWEYKWRSKGEVTGSFSYVYDGSFIGENEIKVEANNSCAIVAAVTYEKLTPFQFSQSLGSIYGMAEGSSGSLPGFGSHGVIPYTKWPMLNSFFSACNLISGINILGFDLNKDKLARYGCPKKSPTEYTIPDFNPNAGQHFNFTNGEVVWDTAG
ncbi:hypothetical protein [Microbulbifer sp. TRSA005]|uniref:hypothetical protein n=1 Tax=unclassified Microbulbifer TaxID=2619833 RepID=UPI00403963B7